MFIYCIESKFSANLFRVHLIKLISFNKKKEYESMVWDRIWSWKIGTKGGAWQQIALIIYQTIYCSDDKTCKNLVTT